MNIGDQNSVGKNDSLDALEAGIQLAYKNGQYEKVHSLASDIRALDPNNRVVSQLLSKLEVDDRPLDDEVGRSKKVGEYENMLRILNTQRDFKKIKQLAQELKVFDPSNKAADKWLKKAERKLLGKGLLASIFSKKPVHQKPVEKLGNPLPDLNLRPTKTVSALSALPTVGSTQTVSKPSIKAPDISTDLQVPKVTTEFIESEAPVKKKLGNTFTRIFGGDVPGSKSGAGSIIDQIVEKTDQKKPKKAQKTPFNWLKFAQGMMNFVLVFVLFTAGFLYLSLDTNNTVLGLFGIDHNTGSNLHAAAQVLSDKEMEVKTLNQEIAVYKTGYNDADIELVQSIIDQRIDWPDTFSKINEVTNFVYDLNDFFNYVEYNNYSLDTDSMTVRLSGTLTDPLGRNLTKLVELEEAFKYYPRDKANPDDPTKPYFYDLKEMTSFSKSLDEETGRFISSFQLSFALNDHSAAEADAQE